MRKTPGLVHLHDHAVLSAISLLLVFREELIAIFYKFEYAYISKDILIVTTHNKHGLRTKMKCFEGPLICDYIHHLDAMSCKGRKF